MWLGIVIRKTNVSEVYRSRLGCGETNGWYLPRSPARMSLDQSQESAEEWPRFTVKCAFGSRVPGIDESFDSDDVVLFDPTRKGNDSWVSASSGSYVSLEETL